MGLRRQTSDTGQETDVSQLSEDEPRVSLRVRRLLSRCCFDGDRFMPLSRRLVLASHQQHRRSCQGEPKILTDSGSKAPLAQYSTARDVVCCFITVKCVEESAVTSAVQCSKRHRLSVCARFARSWKVFESLGKMG